MKKQLENVILMWHTEFYEGIRAGVLLCEDEMHFFRMGIMPRSSGPTYPNPDDRNWNKKYDVYELSADDKIRLITSHALFQAHVGLHTDHWPFNGQNLHKTKSEERGPEIPCCHNGPRVDQTFRLDEYRELANFWEAKYGKFTFVDKEPIGWVSYDQLLKNKQI